MSETARRKVADWRALTDREKLERRRLVTRERTRASMAMENEPVSEEWLGGIGPK